MFKLEVESRNVATKFCVFKPMYKAIITYVPSSATGQYRSGLLTAEPVYTVGEVSTRVNGYEKDLYQFLDELNVNHKAAIPILSVTYKNEFGKIVMPAISRDDFTHEYIVSSWLSSLISAISNYLNGKPLSATPVEISKGKHFRVTYRNGLLDISFTDADQASRKPGSAPMSIYIRQLTIEGAKDFLAFIEEIVVVGNKLIDVYSDLLKNKADIFVENVVLCDNVFNLEAPYLLPQTSTDSAIATIYRLRVDDSSVDVTRLNEIYRKYMETYNHFKFYSLVTNSKRHDSLVSKLRKDAVIADELEELYGELKEIVSVINSPIYFSKHVISVNWKDLLAHIANKGY